MREETRTGVDYLNTVTSLLQRVRNAHPTKGLFEAADMQWWWGIPRSTDSVPQLFWFDEHSQPVAAVIATDWGDEIAIDPMVMPDATPEWVAHVIERGLAHAGELGVEAIDITIDRDDHLQRDLLLGHGFTLQQNHKDYVECWMAAADRPEISPLAEGYRLLTRAETTERPHHMIAPTRPDVEPRLRQTSLYRADLDLVILDEHDDVAAYGLFWFDPDTAIGMVEPMRTEEAHQRRGLARHVLTAGVSRLVTLGAERVTIVFLPDNPASSGLYPDVGFVPVKQTAVLTRRSND